VVNKIQYERGKAYQNPKRAAASAALRRRNREFIRAYLGEHSCVDCGEDDIVVLQFDHQRDKVAHVSTLMRCSSLAAVKAEVAKCEVACANCHTRRTAATYSWWRVSPDDAA
jgi:5-methylcytosine-specific restriction endonuclease McrA